MLPVAAHGAQQVDQQPAAGHRQRSAGRPGQPLGRDHRRQQQGKSDGMRLHLALRQDGGQTMAVGIEHKGESYGLLIDNVGEVLTLPTAGREPNPVNLDQKWAAISGGVHRLNGHLMVILDVDRVLGGMAEVLAA